MGGDIEPFLRRPAELYCDPEVFEGRLRPAAEWRTVKLLIRQTARYPMVVLSDGESATVKAGRPARFGRGRSMDAGSIHAGSIHARPMDARSIDTVASAPPARASRS